MAKPILPNCISDKQTPDIDEDLMGVGNGPTLSQK